MKKKEKWALISVYNKDGIVDFAQRLVKLGWNIISSGGTARKLAGAGVEVKDVADWVGGEAILGHKVVTLSREVHAALLADPKLPEEMRTIADMNLDIIDMVCCDFYPLSDAINEPGATIESVIEQTDIGGPTMVRSGAKGGRAVICRFQDREPVIDELEQHGTISNDTIQRLRAISEYVVAKYCLVSAIFHSKGKFSGIIGEQVAECKYGENAPQTPALVYSTGSKHPLALGNFEVVEGDPPSFNNRCDMDRLMNTGTKLAAGLKLLAPKNEFAIAIGVKHGNPCGASVMKMDHNVSEIVAKMITGDSRAIFGGLVVFNFHLANEYAEILLSEGMSGGNKRVLDAVIAPSASAGAVEILKRKTGRCRVMTNKALGTSLDVLDSAPRIRHLFGGDFMVQPAPVFVLDFKDPKMIVTGTPLGKKRKLDMLLAWAVNCTSNSNTITIVNNGMLIGNGVGQQDRVGAAELAIKRAVDAGHKDKLKGAVACSDSFFPFADGPEVLIEAGITAIFSTTGSRNDDLVRETCSQAGVTLYQLPDKIARGFCGH